MRRGGSSPWRLRRRHPAYIIAITADQNVSQAYRCFRAVVDMQQILRHPHLNTADWPMLL